MDAQTVASEPVPSSRALASRWPQLAATGLIAIVLLALAFADGGYFPDATAAAGAAAFAGLGLLALVRAPGVGLPARAPGAGLPARALAALAALAGLAAWSAISAGWSLVPDAPLLDMQRAMLYLALFALGLLVAQGPRDAAVLVWAVLGVIAVVCGAGLLSHVQPNLVSAQPVVPGVPDSRLSYPLGYWNAFGALATIGGVLAIGLAADPRAARTLRAVAAATSVLLLVAMYLSLSRGAWLAFFVGIVALIALSRHRGTLLATLCVVGTGVAVGLLAPRLLNAGDPVAGQLGGGPQARQDNGYTVALLVIAFLVGVGQARIGDAAASARMRAAAPRARGLALAAAGALVVIAPLAGLLVRNGDGDRVTSAALHDGSSFVSRQWDDFLAPAATPTDQGTARLLSAKSSRSDTYRVALDAFKAQPLHGEGAGSYEVRFMRTRRVDDKVRDAHSLPLQTLAELGLVGFALLLCFLGAVAVALARAVSGRGALRRSQAAAVGAAFVVWLVHACLDWDWEMPALTGAALALGASLFAAGRRRTKTRARRMRLLFVLDQWPELSETFVVNELEALRRLGHDVRVQAARAAPHPNPEAPGDVDVSLLGPGRLGDLAWLVRTRPLACARDLAGRLRWRREEWVRPLRALAGPARRILRPGGDEHLHAHFAGGAALDAMRLSALTGRQYSVTAHAYDIFASPRNLRRKLERAAAVFTGCDYNVVCLRSLVPGAAVHEVVMGVDASAFARTAPPPGARVVLAVGRLVEKKGFDVLVDAAATVDDVEVRILGDGPLRSALSEQIAASGAPVTLLGSGAPADVLAAMQAADVLAMPCVVARDGDRDSMPVVVKEAMAMGMLVVASDEVGLPECVLAPWGFLAAPGDAEALAEALRAALSLDAGERRAAGEAARAWVLEYASVDRETEKMAAVIGSGSG